MDDTEVMAVDESVEDGGDDVASLSLCKTLLLKNLIE